MGSDEARGANQLWEAWTQAVKAASTPAPMYAAFVDQWRNAFGAAPSSTTPASSSAESGRASAGAAPDVLQTLFSGQQALLRMTELTAEAMRTFGRVSAPGSDPAHLITSPALSGLELLMAGAAQYQRLVQPWTELFATSFGGAEAMSGPAGAGDPLGAALERSFGLLADFPGLNSELPALMREATGNFVALARAREEYRAIMAATWQRAFEEISAELLKRAASNKPIETPGALLALSTSVADRIFVETFRTDRYIEAQHSLSTALANHRQCEAKVVDLVARTGHFPTRREHDEALREIKALSREVHELKRAMRTARAARPAAQPMGMPQNGTSAPGSDAAPGEAKRRRNGKAARRAKGYPKRTDHGN